MSTRARCHPTRRLPRAQWLLNHICLCHRCCHFCDQQDQIEKRHPLIHKCHCHLEQWHDDCVSGVDFVMIRFSAAWYGAIEPGSKLSPLLPTVERLSCLCIKRRSCVSCNIVMTTARTPNISVSCFQMALSPLSRKFDDDSKSRTFWVGSRRKKNGQDFTGVSGTDTGAECRLRFGDFC